MTYRIPGRNGDYDVHSWDIEGWQRVYTHLNVENEIQKMLAWVEANPRKKKANVKRFIVNWLSGAKVEPKKMETSTAAYRDRVQSKHREEMKKPEADPEIARKALSEAMALLGIRNGSV